MNDFSYQGSRFGSLSIATPFVRLGRYYHTPDETLDTNSTSWTNQITGMNMDGRWYSFTMKTPAMNHGTVDQGGSICSTQRKSEGLEKVQTRFTSPGLMSCCHGGGMALLLRCHVLGK